MERQVTIDNVATEGDIDKSSSDDDTPYYYYCWLSATVCTCFLTAFLAFALKSLLTKYFAGDGCCASTETYSRGTEEPVASPEAKETKKEVEEQPPEKSVANGDAAPEEIEKTATNVESKATPETKSEEVPKPVNEAPVENVKEKEVENAPPAEAPKPPVEEPKVEEPKVPVEEPKPVEPVVEETKEVVKEIEPVINNEIGQGDRQPEGEVKENKEPTAAAVEE